MIESSSPISKQDADGDSSAFYSFDGSKRESWNHYAYLSAERGEEIILSSKGCLRLNFRGKAARGKCTRRIQIFGDNIRAQVE